MRSDETTVPYRDAPPDTEVQDHLRRTPLSRKTKPKPLVNPQEAASLAAVSSVFLAIWELMKAQWKGAILGVLACLCVMYLTREVGAVFSIILALPVVFEERWNPRAEKDMVRGVLAAGIIAPSVANLLIF